MELGRGYSLGGGFKVIVWGDKPRMDGNISYGEVDSSGDHVNILILQLEEG